MPRKFSENIGRSFVKAITFRLLILCSDGIIIFTITHRYDVTLSVIFFSNFASTILYFLHERIWNNIHCGKLLGFAETYKRLKKSKYMQVTVYNPSGKQDALLKNSMTSLEIR